MRPIALFLALLLMVPAAMSAGPLTAPPQAASAPPPLTIAATIPDGPADLVGAEAALAPPPCPAVDVPLVVDECGDTMLDDLAFVTGSGVAFPAGQLTGDADLAFGGVPVCLAASSAPGCGDISAVLVAAGSGLTGGATSGIATLGTDPGVLQRRVTGVCALGQHMDRIAQDGTTTCTPDRDTTYAAGLGLLLAGTTFSTDLTVVQSRVTGTCTAGSFLTKVLADGSVTCGSPAAGGTVTQVNSGAGLTGGPITTSGTLSIATGGVTNSMLAANAVDASKVVDGSLGSADVNSAQVQLRVAGSCAAGNYVRVVNADGTVTCGADANSGGTVTSVATGNGLTGGPVTTSGTVSLMSCTAGQILKVSGSAWACGTDVDTNSGGTVTSVASGAGLAGGPITGTGTLSIATGGVTTAMLAPGAVTGGTAGVIADGTITSADIATASIVAADIADIPAGDADYIQNQVASGQAASFRMTGTMRMGSETGTSQAPVYPTQPTVSTGLVLRRATSTVATAGSVVAKTDAAQFERDGTDGGWRATSPAGGPCSGPGCYAVRCLGITATGAVIGKAMTLPGNPSAATTIAVFPDSDDVVSIDCSIGLTWVPNYHQTYLRMERNQSGDTSWMGYLLSTTNQ